MAALDPPEEARHESKYISSIRQSPRRNEIRPSGPERRGMEGLVPPLVISVLLMASPALASPPECAGAVCGRG